MSKVYTDYVNQTAVTVPEKYIDVKTGESYPVSQKVREQIEYHAENNTLMHLILSALTGYLHPKRAKGGAEEILLELTEIKRMIQHMPVAKSTGPTIRKKMMKEKASIDVDIQELEEVLDAFSG